MICHRLNARIRQCRLCPNEHETVEICAPRKPVRRPPLQENELRHMNVNMSYSILLETALSAPDTLNEDPVFTICEKQLVSKKKFSGCSTRY